MIKSGLNNQIFLSWEGNKMQMGKHHEGQGVLELQNHGAGRDRPQAAGG